MNTLRLLQARHCAKAMIRTKIPSWVALPAGPTSAVDNMPCDIESVKRSYRQMSVHDICESFNRMNTNDRVYLVNSRILDFVLLRQAPHMDHCEMVRMLCRLLELQVSREAYCFPILSRLLQFTAHRLPMSDLLRLHRALSNEQSFPWVEKLRKALNVSLKSSRKSALFDPRPDDVAHLMSLGYETNAPVRHVHNLPMAVDLMKAAWRMSEERRSAMLAQCREYLLRFEFEGPPQVLKVLEAMIPGQVPDIALVHKLITAILRQDLESEEQRQLLRLMRLLLVFDKRLMRFTRGDGAECRKFKWNFKSFINEECVPFEEVKVSKRSDLATGLCALLKTEYEPLYDVDGAVSTRKNRGFVLLGKGDIVFDTEYRTALSGLGELAKRRVQEKLEPGGTVLALNCLDFNLDRAYAMVRDITDWEVQANSVQPEDNLQQYS